MVGCTDPTTLAMMRDGLPVPFISTA
jgi:hypothetical protein